MSEILFKNGRILTIAGEGREPRRNDALRELGVIESGWVHTKDGLITEVGGGPAPDAIELSSARSETYGEPTSAKSKASTIRTTQSLRVETKADCTVDPPGITGASLVV